MADRVLRGSRLGAVSYETDRNHDLAPRQVAKYRTDNGEEFDVPFEVDVVSAHRMPRDMLAYGEQGEHQDSTTNATTHDSLL